MYLFALTKSTTFIIGPIATLLGYIMEGIARFCSLFGIENVGLYIVLFTIVVNIILLPLTIKQQKFTKMNSVMQPEIQAVQKKYQGKTGDQQAMQQQQAEMNAIYQKYGTSPTSGCLPMLVQMPILFALYRVVYNIPAYVSNIYKIFQNVGDPIMNQPDYFNTISQFISDNGIAVKVTEGSLDSVVDFLYKLSSTQWQDLEAVFPTLTTQIQTAASQIAHVNSFIFGINLMDAPGLKLTPALIIPILAGLTQWISVKVLQVGQPKPAADDRTAGTMKTMNNVMPLMSVVFCISLPACIGIYWVASSAVRTVIQFVINMMMKNTDIDEMIAKNVAKRQKKLERAGRLTEKATGAKAEEVRSALYRNSNMNTASIKTDYNRDVERKTETTAAVDNQEAGVFSGLFGKKQTNSSGRSIAEKARMANNIDKKQN